MPRMDTMPPLPSAKLTFPDTLIMIIPPGTGTTGIVSTSPIIALSSKETMPLISTVDVLIMNVSNMNVSTGDMPAVDMATVDIMTTGLITGGAGKERARF